MGLICHGGNAVVLLVAHQHTSFICQTPDELMGIDARHEDTIQVSDIRYDVGYDIYSDNNLFMLSFHATLCINHFYVLVLIYPFLM